MVPVDDFSLNERRLIVEVILIDVSRLVGHVVDVVVDGLVNRELCAVVDLQSLNMRICLEKTQSKGFSRRSTSVRFGKPVVGSSRLPIEFCLMLRSSQRTQVLVEAAAEERSNSS